MHASALTQSFQRKKWVFIFTEYKYSYCSAPGTSSEEWMKWNIWLYYKHTNKKKKDYFSQTPQISVHSSHINRDWAIERVKLNHKRPLDEYIYITCEEEASLLSAFWRKQVEAHAVNELFIDTTLCPSCERWHPNCKETCRCHMTQRVNNVFETKPWQSRLFDVVTLGLL